VPAAPYPVYVGPTPADPFAFGAHDIFDVIEQAELRPAAPAARQEAPASAAAVQAEPEPVPEPAVEPEAGPAIKPVLIGSGEAVVAERKKGWWRR
jgi:ribonuclease E